MSWQLAIEKTVTGMGYELVDCERGARGLLSVYIDRVPGAVYFTGPSEFVLVEDCEAVTRQLRNVLEVENLDYSRLEVSSPGLDRPLRRVADYERFAGFEIDVALKVVFEGRKNYRGVLRIVEGESEPSFELVFMTGKEEQVLGFVLDEVREARLVPVVDFKGRKRQAAEAPDGAAQETGGHEE
ncbi:MAG: ribosome maturation factor RimP [Leptothrix sp. (in: b-proteobacteria)]